MAGRTVRGVEYSYAVKDRNFGRLNGWKYLVRVPDSSRDEIVVQPVSVPGKQVWAGLDRRSIVFVRATKNPHRSKMYCKVNLADPMAERTKVGTRRGERDLLPRWFDYFRPHMRLKNTVTTTAGHDGMAQVVRVGPEDHRRMVRLFFALKVWVLEEGVVIKE
jgi:hypothetical protein